MIIKKFKFLSLALITSASLNVVLVAALIYFMAERSSDPTSWMGKKEMVTSNGQIFNSMSRLSFRELISFLTNRELLEEGYTKRDLALAALVAYHHFNLEKALFQPCQTRTLMLSKDEKVNLFPGLTEEQFEAIIRYAYQEKWPFTAKGLFKLLLAQNSIGDESLEHAFFFTPEFHTLQTLFKNTNAFQDNRDLLKLAISGPYEILEKFHKEQSKILDFSEEKRREILLSYLDAHSSQAAIILLQTDFTYALKRLDDKKTLSLLSLLKKQSEEGTKFCLELLRSPRGDSIWQAAALTLYSYAGEMPPLPIDPETVLARFAGEIKPAKIEAPLPVSLVPSRFHIVKEGESLWKISRTYKVKVDEIVKINELENDALFPGMTLKLP